jgi:predicted  nucleic acid-binding Zn-ribbon protein
MHWRDKLGHMRHETWEQQARELARLEEREYPRDSFKNHPQWRDEERRTKNELRSLQDENRELKERKKSLEWQLKRAHPTVKADKTVTEPDKQTVTETNGLFGKSEAEWEKEYRRLAEVRRVRHNDEMKWYHHDKFSLTRDIEILKERNDRLRTEIQGLEDELERWTTMSTSLYFHRPEQRHTLGALGWRAALLWRQPAIG